MNNQVWQELNLNAWADPNPFICLCRGSGWLLSDLDSWHKCPWHGENVPHPEEDDQDFDPKAHLLDQARSAFVYFREEARKAGFVGNFPQACLKAAGKTDLSPMEWLVAAELVIDNLLARLGRHSG